MWIWTIPFTESSCCDSDLSPWCSPLFWGRLSLAWESHVSKHSGPASISWAGTPSLHHHVQLFHTRSGNWTLDLMILLFLSANSWHTRCAPPLPFLSSFLSFLKNNPPLQVGQLSSEEMVSTQWGSSHPGIAGHGCPQRSVEHAQWVVLPAGCHTEQSNGESMPGVLLGWTGRNPTFTLRKYLNGTSEF